MDKLQAYRSAFQALPEGCAAAEVNLICKENTAVTCVGGALTGCGTSEKNMLFIRATGTATGIVYCENLAEEPGRLIQMALDNASVVDAAAPQPMLANARDSHVDEEPAASAEELTALAMRLSLLPEVSECSVTGCVRTSQVLNSLGTETLQRQSCYTLALRCGQQSLERSAHRLTEIDAEEMLQQLQQQSALAHEELPYIKLTSGRYDTVLSAAVIGKIMNTLWQLFAQRLIDTGRSPLRLGERIGSERLHIVDCPTAPRSGHDYTIDCEGVRGPAETRLVSAGVVTDTLRTLKQSDSTGSAGRADLLSANIHTELISLPRNIWIVPGEEQPEELLARMGTGIHLTYSMDEYHSLNIARGSFAIPCGGVYYENGKAVGRVQQMTLFGTVRDLFAGLEAAGSDLAMRPMWPHYDYCFGGPSLLIRGADFAM